mgnify:CR=1 FL=1
MKRILALILVVLTLTAALCGCGNDSSTSGSGASTTAADDAKRAEMQGYVDEMVNTVRTAQ